MFDVDKQRLANFINAVADGATGRGAAITAGYSKTYAAQAAHRLMKRTDVRRALTARKAEKDAASVNAPLTKEWAEVQCRRIIEDCMTAENRDYPTARSTIATLATIKGWIAPSKSEAVKVDLVALARQNPVLARELMAQQMRELPEADRAELARREPTVITLATADGEKTE